MARASATAKAKRGSSTQDPPVGRAQKAARHGQAGDAPTALGLEGPGTTTDNGGGKENGVVASRPVRSNAGKGGQLAQLKKAANLIRPDLDDHGQKTVRGNKSFPEHAPENEFAPPLPQRRQRAPRKVPALQNTGVNQGPQLRRPTVPEQPLSGPPLPSLQLALPGSQFGFSAPTNHEMSTPQVSAHRLTNPILNQSSQLNQGPMQPSTGHAFEHLNPVPAPRGPTAHVPHANQNQHTLNVGASTGYAQTQPQFNFSRDTDQIAFQSTGEMDGMNYQDDFHSRQGFNNNNQNYNDHYDHYDHNDHYNFSADTQQNATSTSYFNNHQATRNDPTAPDAFSNGNFGVPHVGPIPDAADDQNVHNRYETSDEEDEIRNDDSDDDLGQVDETSPSEDEAVAAAALRGSSPHNSQENTVFPSPAENHGARHVNDMDSEDVLQAHRRRNQAQRPPSSERLAQAASRQMRNRQHSFSDNSDSEGDDSDRPKSTDENASAPKRAARNSKKTKPARNPENLSFYPEEWSTVLVQAQQRWQRHLVLGRPDPFPEREHHLHEARKILTDVIAESLNDGQLLDDTYTHTRQMDVCVFAEHSTWRSELKNVAAPIVAAKYANELETPADYCGGQLEAYRMIKENVKELLQDSSFHLHGRDENGRTNNIAHPAIAKIITEFFYTGENCLASLFPEDFSHAVPEHVIGLVMTVIQNCLEEWLPLAYKKVLVPFRGSTYRPVFVSMMTAIDNIKANPYHGAKFEANRARWARMGMANLQRSNELPQNQEVKVVLD